MYDFSNNKTHNGILYTRYIMSWIFATGDSHFGRRSKFADWLRETQELTEDEISDICDLAECGKFELQVSAERFYKEN